MTALPGWLEPLPDAEQMRATDAWAIDELKIPSLDLMERAGAGLADAVAQRAPEGRIAVVCGKGNNGGDGLVAARVLRTGGRDVDVLLIGAPEDFSGDAAENLRRLSGDPPEAFAPERLDGTTAIVDALLGTGFSGVPREPVAGAIEAINAAEALAIATDVPSGVDASTGTVEGAAVHAAETVTFHSSKLGLWVRPGKDHVGEVRVIDIGIPPGAPVEPTAGLILDSVRDEIPRRRAGSTKFSEGAVLVVGGSSGLTGAPSLAAESAARAGAGYVTAAIPGSLSLIFEIRLLEAMTRSLPDDDGALGPEAVNAVLAAAERADALVLGPGVGRADATQEFARRVAAEAPLPLLLDADGLNAHAGRLESLAARSAPTVLTPHAGELARLLETESAEIERTRVEHARRAAAASGAVIVLKGDDSIVADPGGRVAVSRGGSGGLATAGTGDVLSGVTGAMLAKGLDPFTAASAAVWLHSSAGARAAAARGADGMIASDVIEELPGVLAE